MKEKYFKREKYLSKIRPFYHSDIVKVITGIRRCGKSFIMRMIADELIESGVTSDKIIYLDLDRRENRKIKTPEQLEVKIESLLSDGFNYLFIDEIQNVVGFEEVINAFNTDGNISIFLTGSNSYLLSGEIATKLTGRYLEFEIFTLNFNEYLDMKKMYGKEINSNINIEFQEYIRFGGFPKSLEFDEPIARYKYVEGVINEIFEKDIKSHNKIKYKNVFDRVQKYVLNNFGMTFSVNNLFDYFNKVDNTPIAKETIRKYIQILLNAKIIYECPRFDCKSKKSLSGEQKYYLPDLSFYFMNNTDARINYGPVLENLVFLFLKQKDLNVSVGKIGNLECDFIARKNFEEYFYIQVSYSVAEEKAENREFRVFEKIRDNYPKYLLTLDPLLQSRDGIFHKNLIEFLKDDFKL